MGHPVLQGMRRIDVAKLLQNSLDPSMWKGDDHTKGVFFTDGSGYVLNKIMAVRIRHHQMDHTDLFYSFHHKNPEGGEVSEAFPFQSMKKKPKKHFLLFDKETITKPDIGSLFAAAKEYSRIKVCVDDIRTLISTIHSKRERERSAVILRRNAERLLCSIVKSKAKKRGEHLDSVEISHELLAYIDESIPIKATLNALTLSCVLDIFSQTPYVVFGFSHDRIIITGEKTDGDAEVEVVVSQMKTT